MPGAPNLFTNSDTLLRIYVDSIESPCDADLPITSQARGTSSPPTFLLLVQVRLTYSCSEICSQLWPTAQYFGCWATRFGTVEWIILSVLCCWYCLWWVSVYTYLLIIPSLLLTNSRTIYFTWWRTISSISSVDKYPKLTEDIAQIDSVPILFCRVFVNRSRSELPLLPQGSSVDLLYFASVIPAPFELITSCDFLVVNLIILTKISNLYQLRSHPWMFCFPSEHYWLRDFSSYRARGCAFLSRNSSQVPHDATILTCTCCGDMRMYSQSNVSPSLRVSPVRGLNISGYGSFLGAHGSLHHILSEYRDLLHRIPLRRRVQYYALHVYCNYGCYADQRGATNEVVAKK